MNLLLRNQFRESFFFFDNFWLTMFHSDKKVALFEKTESKEVLKRDSCDHSCVKEAVSAACK